MLREPIVLSSQVVVKGWVNCRVDRLQLVPSGVKMDYHVVESGDGCGVLAFLDHETVLVARQYRLPVQETILELIQGGIHDGETALEAIQRELLEETGYQAKTWEYVGTVFHWPTAVTSRVHLFYASGLTWVQNPEDDPREEMELVTMRFDDLLYQVRMDKHHDAALRDVVHEYALRMVYGIAV